MKSLKPWIGSILVYTLDEIDAAQINRRRTTGPAIAERIGNNRRSDEPAREPLQRWPLGAQAHIGNEVKAGDVFPMIVTRLWSDSIPDSDAVNGQVFLDGNDVLWATSVSEGDGGHTWTWPTKL